MSEVFEAPNGGQFTITVTAVGEVRDAEGNLLNSDAELTGSTQVNSEQLLAFLEGMK